MKWFVGINSAQQRDEGVAILYVLAFVKVTNETRPPIRIVTFLRLIRLFGAGR